MREIFLSIAVLMAISCTKEPEIHPPLPERVLSMPEKVEKEIVEVLSKDWKSLADTIAYFNSVLLSKGRLEGRGPDGVYYGLRFSFGNNALTMDFQVEDSLCATIRGRVKPLELGLGAFDTEISIEKETRDSIGLRFSRVRIISPAFFISDDGHQASLLYEGSRVGFITREELENTDYSTGKYIVIHYYEDPRTFALYDKGLFDLLELNLLDVLK